LAATLVHLVLSKVAPDVKAAAAVQTYVSPPYVTTLAGGPGV
jgi:hypothetical protein